jgi:hypothetical protein
MCPRIRRSLAFFFRRRSGDFVHGYDQMSRSMNKPTEEAVKDSEGPSHWFYVHQGEVHGPVSSIDLRAAAYLGFLGPNDLVRRADLEKWVAACSVRGLFKESA